MLGQAQTAHSDEESYFSVRSGPIHIAGSFRDRLSRIYGLIVMLEIIFVQV